MAFVDETAKAVYKSFNNSQMRELALAAKVPSDRVAQMNSSTQAAVVVDGITDRTRLALLAHRVETISPYKHCVLLEAKNPFTFLSLSARCKAAFPGLFNEVSPLDSTERDLHAQLCIVDKEAERVFIKFAHMVEVYEFTKTTEGLLRTPAWRRHVIVVQISSPLQLVSISFPGFSQPVSTGSDRVTYNKFALQVEVFLSETLKLSLEAFKVKPVTDLLLEDTKADVVDLKRTLRFQRGGKMDLDSESDQDAATSLAQGLVASGIRISAEAIRLAFRASEAQAIVLLWRKTGLITRLSLRESLPELLFIWNEADPSGSLIDGVLRVFSDKRTLIGPSRVKEALQQLMDLEVGEVIRPTWLEQQFGLTPDQAMKMLLDQCAVHRFSAVFRMRPDRAVSSGVWVSSLVDLPRHATDLEGNVVASTDPVNIEVGFKRAVR